MGTIKFEIDLPEFKNELSINLIIRKDGEVIYSTSSPVTGNVIVGDQKRDSEESKFNGITENKTSGDGIIRQSTALNEGKINKSSEVNRNKSNRILGGNMMNIDSI